MPNENEFYTVAFLKAFAGSAEVYADRESELLWKVAMECSVEEADICYEKLNEEAAQIASCSFQMQPEPAGC